LASALCVKDETFLTFIHGLLQYDPSNRLTAIKALSHPFLQSPLSTRVMLKSSNPKQHEQFHDQINDSNLISPYVTPTKEINGSVHQKYTAVTLSFDENLNLPSLPDLNKHDDEFSSYLRTSNFKNQDSFLAEKSLLLQAKPSPKQKYWIDEDTSMALQKLSSSYPSSIDDMEDVDLFHPQNITLSSPRKLLDDTLGSLVDDIWKSLDHETSTNMSSDPKAYFDTKVVSHNLNHHDSQHVQFRRSSIIRTLMMYF
jgi:serine/threonine protein kinase